MTIHDTHPFADGEPDPVRRFRGRLGGTGSRVTTGAGSERAGLTVSSLMVAHGDPARVVMLLDPDSDLAERLNRSDRAVVQLLSWSHRALAAAFAGTAPAPGGPWRMATFEDTRWGPRLVGSTAWVGVRREMATDAGWSQLVMCVIETVEIGADDEPLVSRRGRWVRP